MNLGQLLAFEYFHQLHKNQEQLDKEKVIKDYSEIRPTDDSDVRLAYNLYEYAKKNYNDEIWTVIEKQMERNYIVRDHFKNNQTDKGISVLGEIMGTLNELFGVDYSKIKNR